MSVTREKIESHGLRFMYPQIVSFFNFLIQTVGQKKMEIMF